MTNLIIILCTCAIIININSIGSTQWWFHNIYYWLASIVIILVASYLAFTSL